MGQQCLCGGSTASYASCWGGSSTFSCRAKGHHYSTAKLPMLLSDGLIRGKMKPFLPASAAEFLHHCRGSGQPMQMTMKGWGDGVDMGTVLQHCMRVDAE